MCVTHWLLVPLQKQGSPPRQSSPCLAGMYGATQGRVHPQTGVIHKQGTGPWRKPQQSPIPSLHRALLKPWCWCYCCALGSVMASGGGVPGKNIETNNTIKFLQQNWNKQKKECSSLDDIFRPDLQKPLTSSLNLGKAVAAPGLAKQGGHLCQVLNTDWLQLTQSQLALLSLSL